MNPGFFFQAEDGIRDGRVTGVQTCALPIWTLVLGRRFLDERIATELELAAHGRELRPADMAGHALESGLAREARSEERRVGKECRNCMQPGHNKESGFCETDTTKVDPAGGG